MVGIPGGPLCFRGALAACVGWLVCGTGVTGGAGAPPVSPIQAQQTPVWESHWGSCPGFIPSRHKPYDFDAIFQIFQVPLSLVAGFIP